MFNLRHCRHNRLLLVLAIVCAVGTARAQEFVSAPNVLPVLVDRKQAASMLLTQSAPEYPPVAKVNYIEGRVMVELTVSGKGNVTDAHVLNGNAILAVSALKAIRRWIYHPLSTPSGPAEFITTVRVNYSLHSRAAELTPQRAEQDFLRQVKPPQVMRPPEDAPSGDVVHVRLLINDQGQVVDTEFTPLGGVQLAAAREILQGWTFRPAHWGNLPIASYVEIDIPLGAASIARATASPGTR